MLVVILMGSKGDLDHAKKIAHTLEKFEVPYVMRVASAHKIPLKVLEIIKEYEEKDVVYITIAGRSNALSGFTDANTTKPVIACPPYSERFGGVDIFSTLRMPSGVAPLTILEPEEAALAAVKILAMKYENLKEKIKKYHEEKRKEIEKADEEVRSNG
ncbi:MULTISPECIES: 5-(carboxyamino)imidazole ribonucleotide mutase [Dictyoglomus]|uniref:Phosphoribosylaminoimidazole carboxylase n=1 Tax=Dictyoglomus turgidum (strain DSM 6724 / Z-1310) TaxID=515635 RepID=B8DYW9_DICTD|nr:MULTISPECIES: 5-(carboxyamino)imidazole ribonucleotide mutase [Dictyoglomus]ACK41595.1 phosphoribosylaminoimidazole carboxylase, catalytic subunit [Dictyoglomus turgidum DSM 6724]HBU31686.1 5-(carboxyamino)imidazole ribonucleotide mutase [Dictyoglomus sp.]